MICAVNENDCFDGFLHPLEPDIIGQAFVMQFLYEHWHKKKYVYSLLTDSYRSMHFFIRCRADFDKMSKYDEILNDDSYIWQVIIRNLNISEIMLSETGWKEKLYLMSIIRLRFNLYYDNAIIFKSLITKQFFDFVKDNNFSDVFPKEIRGMLLTIDENIVSLATLLMNCKRRYCTDKEFNVYLSEGAQYLQQIGFSKEFCTICEKANLNIKCNKPIESQIIEIISVFCEMSLNYFYPEPYLSSSALYLLNNEIILNDFYKDYSIIQSFNEFVIFMEGIDVESDSNESEETLKQQEIEQILRLTSGERCLDKKQKINQLLAISLAQDKFDLAKYYCHKLWNE